MAAASGLADLTTVVEGHTIKLVTLNAKVSQISYYSSATSLTTISQTLYSPPFELTTLDSGFNQTSTDQITLAGEMRCNNSVEINSLLYLVENNNIIVEGIINQDNANQDNANQDNVNQFLAPTHILGNVVFSGANTTINSTPTQIGLNATSNLNVNSTTSFGGDVIIGIKQLSSLRSSFHGFFSKS